MKKINKRLIALGVLALLFCTFCGLTVFAASAKDDAAPTAVTAQAEESVEEEDSTTGSKAIAAAVCVGVAAAAAAVSMGIAIGKSSEGISRQPEAAGNIRAGMMLGLVFIETVVIYALIVAILIIFVL